MTLLCSTAVTTAVTGSIQTPQTGFGKVTALTIQAAFTYVASAATSCDAYIQTSLDGGTTWADIANFHFTTASATNIVNVSGLTAVTTPTAITDGSIANNTVQQGILGDRYRVKITSVGTYGAGTTLAVNVQAR